MAEPEWLTTIRHQYAYGEAWILLAERNQRAVVKAPGRHVYSGQGRPFRYVRVTFYGVRAGGVHDLVEIAEGVRVERIAGRIEAWLNDEWGIAG
jgi:hypothetical protein